MASSPPQLGHDLYQVLPALYRERDGGDLRVYLAACGELLDQVHQTLSQKLADNFPDNPTGGTPGPDSGLACQDWLLPYFADLLDVRLRSPLVAGRRDEIAHAVAWRQRKGTRAVIEQILEAVAQTEAVLQEGWQRVAMTPRVRQPQLPATAHGYALDPLAGGASLQARHPGLPAAMVDTRLPSGAVPAPDDNPAVQFATVNGTARQWRQASRHGAPCHPGTFEDVSPRTVDVRTPDWRVGHQHPRRILLHYPPPGGFFASAPITVNWSDGPKSASFLEHIEIDESDPHRTVFRLRQLEAGPPAPVRIRLNITLAGVAEDHLWRFENLLLENTVMVENGRVEFADCAVRRVVSPLARSDGFPVVGAVDTLMGTIETPAGLSRLEYVTVLGATCVRFLEASDCLFAGPVQRATDDSAPPEDGCVRFSSVTPRQDLGTLRQRALARDPVFFHAAEFGAHAAGVLHPATRDSVCAGAEDGGEVGAFHHAFHCQARRAVMAKLADFLPLGQEAVLIPDERLLAAPVAPPPA
jgi:hypothetical protein